MKYPKCKKVDVKDVYFGKELEDPYRWLTEAKAPEVLQWVEEENAFTNQWFDQEELEAKIRELKENRIEPTFQLLTPWGEGYGAIRSEEGAFKAYRLDRNLKIEALVMDNKTLAGFAPFQILVSPVDARYILIAGIYEGDSEMTALVIDCKERKILKRLPKIFYIEWFQQSLALYYPKAEADVETKESRIRVLRYDLKTDSEKELLVCQGIIGEIHASGDGRHVMIEIWKDYMLSYFYSMDEEKGKITDITNGNAVQMKYMDTLAGVHYFDSKESEPTGKIVAVRDGQCLKEAWTVVGACSGTLCGGFAVGKALFVLMTENVSYKLAKVSEGILYPVELPGRYGTLTVVGRKQDQVFLRYESFTDAPMLLSFNGQEMKIVSKSREKEYPEVVTEQRWAMSKEDGAKIPYFIVHRQDALLDGSNPTWIYAYGGYNLSMYPWSSDMVTGVDVAEWVEDGGIYVLANIRGGGEFGAGWHEAGMKFRKRNCYGDFIGVSEQLLKDGWTRPEKIAIDGCSNGGLLMSTLVTMRPDLFGCVIDSVPHTDMIHFAEDNSGPRYITEYGNPKESQEMFEYLLSYSPYHNVKAVDYPSVYIQTGECDNNVPPYHGKKFAARMQELNTSENPILLRVLKKGSHDRGTGEDYWRTIAEIQLFAKKVLGI